ncbi:hypothetical protein PO909_000267 [Leuciscus waleckii]
MSNISVCCGEIESAVGFVYVILHVILNHTLNEDCEQSWYSEDRRLIADPSDPETLSDPVISVSSDRLVTSRCVNVLHEILCDASGVNQLSTHHSSVFILNLSLALFSNASFFHLSLITVLRPCSEVRETLE